MGRQVGGRESLGYTKLDQKNYLITKRQKDLAYGEVGYLLKYFSDETLKNIHHFSIVCSWIMRNVLLIYFGHYAKMMIDYGQFRDVLSFDTTYKVNKENRPFAAFVGFNHHRVTIIFGAAWM